MDGGWLHVPSTTARCILVAFMLVGRCESQKIQCPKDLTLPTDEGAELGSLLPSVSYVSLVSFSAGY
jgi:hypothetical protein